MSISLNDLKRLGETALDEFDARIQASATLSPPTIEKSAERLEAKLEQLYATAVALAQREESMDQVAAIWTRMVTVCDEMAAALSNAKGDELESYDRILDIRNICEENRALHA